MPEGPVVVADDAIAEAEAALAGLGRVHRFPAAAIGPELLARLEAEALIVRSVTRVDEALIAAVPSLRFVGTATAGVDHVETAALAKAGVRFANAAGCNAQAVAEWVVAALIVTAAGRPGAAGHLDPELLRGPVGLVGHGQVGRRLSALLRRLGFEVLACDPPLARTLGQTQTGQTQTQTRTPCGTPLVPFDELWARSSIVSFHVPLIRSGPDATVAYLTRQRPAIATPKLVINTSRGPVIPDSALDRPDIAAAILDVWDGEPDLAWARLDDPRILLASPHVAGYSLEAKIRATQMIHQALAAHLGRPPTWTGAEQLPPRTLNGPLGGFVDLPELLTRVVDLPGDDARVRALASQPAPERPGGFESLRRTYRLRREFSAWRIGPETVPDPDLRAWLARAGFSLVTPLNQSTFSKETPQR